MKKVTLTFPSYDSMWLFKSLTNAIHIRIEPRKHRICGSFDNDEIEMAIAKFNAVQHSTDLGEKLMANTKMPA